MNTHQPLSQFLGTPHFDASRPVVVLAGKDHYPVLIVDRIRSYGLPVKVVAFEGETCPDLFNSFANSDRAMIKVGQLGKMLKALKKFNAGYALMAGQITPRRLFKGLHPDLKAITILAKLKEKNAESIFGSIASEIEKLGIQQLDARAFLDDQLAEEGVMTGGQLAVKPADLEYGIKIAKEIARLDIGQGVVVRNGTVLAVEAFEGTDAMLRRSGEFSTDTAIFVKTVKENQDYRFDVPVFGLRTIQTMKEAGLKVAALEIGKVIILEKEKVFQEAKKHKIQIIGY